jgi:hypothetical protein
MKLKKLISVLLILVLSIQLLPVKQMVSWLLSGQMTEEIVHAKDASKNAGADEEVNKHFLANNTSLDIAPHTQSLLAAHHEAETLVARHADDIPTPPPNC